MDYLDYIETKRHVCGDHGFCANFCPDASFDFQRDLIAWACRKGRAAIFADCGMGKTLMQLAWAQNVAEHAQLPVLILTPLAVSAQTVAEGKRFGIDATRSIDGAASFPVTVTNYEKLHLFSHDDFGGVVCDESSILKSFDGARRAEITQFMRKAKYRLLATATAAPNDYTELGTSSEALGYMGHVDMLGRYFKNDQNSIGNRRFYGEAPKWRFKGHSETDFWRWVVSWARALRKPSDIGHDDAGFDLPPLVTHKHLVEPKTAPPGMLFSLPACDLASQREESKRTVGERVGMAADVANASADPVLVMCQRNDEGDALEKAINGAVQVSGKDSDESKERKFMQFLDGSARVLVTKPKIGAWGLNFQHCAKIVYFPSHSYEQYYQSVRRCWRFGQDRQVDVHLILTEGLSRVMDNLEAKADKASVMFDRLVGEMNNESLQEIDNSYNKKELVPSWL